MRGPSAFQGLAPSLLQAFGFPSGPALGFGCGALAALAACFSHVGFHGCLLCLESLAKGCQRSRSRLPTSKKYDMAHNSLFLFMVWDQEMDPEAGSGKASSKISHLGVSRATFERSSHIFPPPFLTPCVWSECLTLWDTKFAIRWGLFTTQTHCHRARVFTKSPVA